MARGRVESVRRTLTAPWRAVPGFVVIGAMRSATTSLYHCLRQHPQVVTAGRKQVHWLDLWPQRSSWWYRSRFPLERNVPAGGMTGESSPYYLAHPEAAHRALERLPVTTRYVAILRDPVARLISQHRHQVAIGAEHRSLGAVVEHELANGRALEAAHPPGSPEHRSLYLLRGRYAEQLERWFAAVGRERVLVLRTVDLAERPDEVLDRVVEHLGLAPFTGWRPQRRSTTTATEAPPAEVVERLDDFYTPHDEALRQLTGIDVTSRPGVRVDASGGAR